MRSNPRKRSRQTYPLRQTSGIQIKRTQSRTLNSESASFVSKSETLIVEKKGLDKSEQHRNLQKQDGKTILSTEVVGKSAEHTGNDNDRENYAPTSAGQRVLELEKRLEADEREKHLLRAKIASLDEKCFTLGMQLACRAAEEQHGNPQIVKNLKDKLAFTENELRNTTCALRKIQQTNAKLQQRLRILENNEQKSYRITRSNLDNGQRASVNQSSTSLSKVARVSSKFLTSLNRIYPYINWIDADVFELLRACPEIETRRLYGILIERRSSEMLVSEIHSSLVQACKCLIRLMRKTCGAARLLQKLLAVASDLVVHINREEKLNIFEIALLDNNDQKIRSSALDTLLTLVNLTSGPSADWIDILKRMQESSFPHSEKTFELYAAIAGTHLRGIAEWEIPPCGIWFGKYQTCRSSIVAVCATLISVFGEGALKTFCEQKVIHRLVEILNQLKLSPSRLNGEHSEGTKECLRSTSFLLSVLLRYDLEYEVDKEWRRLELIRILRALSCSFSDIEDAVYRSLDMLMTM